jgi:hypothetical protein
VEVRKTDTAVPTLVLDKTRRGSTQKTLLTHAFANRLCVSLYSLCTALPKTEQSLAYLLRNEILGNVEDLRAELAYLVKVVQDDNNEAKTEAMDDARLYASQANNAMQRYLQIVSPKELRAAEELLLSEI